MNEFILHAVATSLPTSGHSLSMGEFYTADIPRPSHEILQLKLNLHLNPCQFQLRHRISENSEALISFLPIRRPPRIRQQFWLIEYPAQSTQARTIPYRRDHRWSVTTFFSFRLTFDPSSGPT